MTLPIQLKRPYNIMDVANYIISIRPINHELLTLTLYYANAYCLVNQHRQLIRESFKKWGHGPNNEIVNSYFKDYGAAPITKPACYLIVVPNRITTVDPKDHLLNPEDAQMVRYVAAQMVRYVADQLYRYYHHDSFELVKITQQEPMWKPYRKMIAIGDIDNEYTTQEITDYFKDNQHWPWR